MKRLVGVLLVMATVTALRGMDEVVSGDSCERTVQSYKALESGSYSGIFTCSRTGSNKKGIPNDEDALFTLLAIRYKSGLLVTRYHHTGAFLVKYTNNGTLVRVKERLTEAGFRVEEEPSFRAALIRRMAARRDEGASASAAAAEAAGTGDDSGAASAASTRTCAPGCNVPGHGHNWTA